MRRLRLDQKTIDETFGGARREDGLPRHEQLGPVRAEHDRRIELFLLDLHRDVADLLDTRLVEAGDDETRAEPDLALDPPRERIRLLGTICGHDTEIEVEARRVRQETMSPSE